MEIEAKFRIPDEEAFRRLLEVPALAGFTLGEVSVAELYDRYLDTADRALLAAGFACRLRRQGNRTLVTVKGIGGATGAVHRRTEDEVELDGPLPPADWPPGAARDRVLQLSGGEPLALILEIEQSRHTRPLSEGERAVAELGLDRVRVRRGTEPVAQYLELEAELVPGGREEDLLRLAAELQQVWGLVPESQSKFEAALALVDARLASTDDAEPDTLPDLTPDERAVVEWMAQERDVISRRARLLLAWDDGASRAEMIRRSRLSPRRARYWRRTFQQRRLGIFPKRMLRAAAVETGLPALQPSPTVPAVEVAAPKAVLPAAQEPVAPPKSVVLLKQPGVEPDDPMSEAGRKILRFHFRRMLFNEPGTRLGEDIEALHDMRVATRRMRAAFRVFEDHFEPNAVAPFLNGLRRTGRALGAVRDLDVFREKINAYQDTLAESQRGSLDGFLAVLDAQLEVARGQMIAWLDAGKYRRFVERFEEFVETPGRGSRGAAADGGEPLPYRVRHVAPMAIYERLAAVRAYDEWVGIPNPPVTRLHALRIASKRLRYTLEFFTEVLGPETKQLVRVVVAMQDHLGELQDAVVASGILRDYLVWGTWGPGIAARPVPGPDVAVIAPGVASYLAVRQSELQQLLATFPPIWQGVAGVEFSRMVAQAVAVL